MPDESSGDSSHGNGAIALVPLAVFGVAAILGVAMMAVAGSQGGGMMGYYWGNHWGWIGVIGALMMLIPLVFVVFLVYLLLGVTGGKATRTAPSRPLDEARLRYARGEISRAQFEELMADLGRTG